MRALIRLCVSRFGAVAALTVLALVLGFWGALRTPLDVFPEFVPSEVEIQTEAPGFSPQQVEDLVTKPVENIPKFDSKVWPVATTILSIEIGATIPNDVNIFVDETTKLPRSIDETAAFVCELLKKQTEKEAAAA